MNGVPEQDYRMMKQRAEAAEASAAELDKTVDEQQRRIEELERELKRQSAYIHIDRYDQVRPRTLSEYESETPFGLALDGLGDEVE